MYRAMSTPDVSEPGGEGLSNRFWWDSLYPHKALIRSVQTFIGSCRFVLALVIPLAIMLKRRPIKIHSSQY